MAKRTTAAVMQRVKDAFKEANMSLEELGRRMDYPPATARKSAWQFLNKTEDPRLSMLLKFCRAINKDMRTLFGDASKDESRGC